MNTKKKLNVRDILKPYSVKHRYVTKSFAILMMCMGLFNPTSSANGEITNISQNISTESNIAGVDSQSTLINNLLQANDIIGSNNNQNMKFLSQIVSEPIPEVIEVEIVEDVEDEETSEVKSVVEEIVTEEVIPDVIGESIEPVQCCEVVEEPPIEVVPEVVPEIPDITICYEDIRVISNASIDSINTALKGTWLEGYGQLYYDLEHEYGINAFLAIANAIQETGWDINNSNIATTRNNIYGLKDKSFNNIEECIRYYFHLINKYYVGQGYISMEQINTKYCPPDTTWASDIFSIANKLNNKVIDNIQLIS